VAWLMLHKIVFCLQVAKTEVQTLLLLITLFLELLWQQNSTKLHGLLAVSHSSNSLTIYRLVLSPTPDHQGTVLNKKLANRINSLGKVGRFEQTDMGVNLNRFYCIRLSTSYLSFSYAIYNMEIKINGNCDKET
jgi:hypothetical protein